MDLSIFVKYNVQYVAIASRSSTNCISIFTNHKGAMRILNAFVSVSIGFF
jgi:hypothetical protein